MLNEHSRQFQATAKRVKNKYWWKNLKVKLSFSKNNPSHCYIIFPDVDHYYCYYTYNYRHHCWYVSHLAIDYDFTDLSILVIVVTTSKKDEKKP